MGRYHDFDEEFARADQREKELQRQLGMDDGVSTPRPASTPQQGFGGYNNTPGGFGNNYNGYNNGFGAYNNNAGNYGAANNYSFQPPQQFGTAFAGRNVYTRTADPRATKRAFTAISVIFYFVSVVLLGVMVIVATKLHEDYKGCTADVQAQVLGNRSAMKRTSGNKVRTKYYAVYSYEFEGKQYKGVSKTGSTNPKYRAGDIVTIHVDPDDPTRFYDQRDDYVVYTVLGSIGGSFFLLAVVFTVAGHKVKKKMQSSMQ